MYDLIIIGAGPAGYTAALEASYRNKSVLLIEKNELGGTCLNVGCIPTKSLLKKSEDYYNARKSKDFNININDSFYKNLMDDKSSVVEKQKKGIEYLLKKAKVKYIKGIATLVDEHCVSVDGVEYNGEFILLATGSSPLIPKIDGIENAIFSDEILSMDYSKIDDIIIIGGGFIGVEIATIFTNLEKRVIIVEAQDRLLTNMDQDVSSSVKRVLKKDGCTVLLNSKVTKIEKDGIYIDDKKIEASTILCAIGRVSNTKDVDPLSLIEKDRGSIVVDSEFKTNIKNIYAIGDCINSYKLAHYASSLAIYSVNNMFNTITNIQIKNVPSCVYTNSEIATVGESECDDDVCIKHSLISNARCIINDESRGFIKLIFRKDGYFKGASINCSRASDMITIFVSALNNHYNIDDMLKDIYPHPSFSEGIKDSLVEVKHKFDSMYT